MGVFWSPLNESKAPRSEVALLQTDISAKLTVYDDIPTDSAVAQRSLQVALSQLQVRIEEQQLHHILGVSFYMQTYDIRLKVPLTRSCLLSPSGSIQLT